jgi:hypothetical protein
MDRRGFLKAGLTSAALLPVAGTIFAARIARAEDELVTQIEANQVMVTALQYVETSAKPDQNCANCQLYTPGADGKGKCQLFQLGVVPDGGWCMSWTKKVS